MRRGEKRKVIIEFPYADPEEITWIVTPGIPVEIPAPYEPAVPEPQRQPAEPQRKEDQ